MAAKHNPSTLGNFSTTGKLLRSSSSCESFSRQGETSSRNHASNGASLSLSPPPSSPKAPCLELLGRISVSPLSPPLSSMPVNRPVLAPTVTNGTTLSPLYPSVAGHTNFKQIVIHTAKCDKCNDHNKATLNRCTTCGFQICTPCWLHRGGGHHTVTRTFRGPVFDPNAVDEDEDEGNDEEDEIKNGDVSMSDASDDAGDDGSDVMIISDNEDGEEAINNIDEHAPPPPLPNFHNFHNSSLDIAHRDSRIGESHAMYIYRSGSRDGDSEDNDSVNELPANQTIRARRIIRRSNREPSSSQGRDETSGDESVIQISCQPASGSNSNSDTSNEYGHLYYNDLAPESRERIDTLISTAISLFQDAAVDRQATDSSISSINQRGPYVGSPLFVPIGPDDHLTPVYNERISHRAHFSSSPRTGHRHLSDKPRGEETGVRGQTTRQLPSPPAAPPRKRKTGLCDVEERQGVWKGPFLDESTDEERGCGPAGCTDK